MIEFCNNGIFDLTPQPPLRKRGGGALFKNNALIAERPSPAERGRGRGQDNI